MTTRIQTAHIIKDFGISSRYIDSADAGAMWHMHWMIILHVMDMKLIPSDIDYQYLNNCMDCIKGSHHKRIEDIQMTTPFDISTHIIPVMKRYVNVIAPEFTIDPINLRTWTGDTFVITPMDRQLHIASIICDDKWIIVRRDEHNRFYMCNPFAKLVLFMYLSRYDILLCIHHI